MADKTTTAQILGTYCRELQAEGVDQQIVETLVIEGARSLLRENVLTVSDEPTEIDSHCRCGAVHWLGGNTLVGVHGVVHGASGCHSN